MSFVYWIKYVTKYIQEVLKLELFLPTHNIVKLYRNTMSFLNIDINFTKNNNIDMNSSSNDANTQHWH